MLGSLGFGTAGFGGSQYASAIVVLPSGDTISALNVYAYAGKTSKARPFNFNLMALNEHRIIKGNLLPKFRDVITLPSAVNLTGATFEFLYQKPESSTVTRTATLVSGSAKPSLTSATSFDLEFAPTTGDCQEVAVFNYQWRIHLSGEIAPLDVPNEVPPESDGSARQFQRFEVAPTL